MLRNLTDARALLSRYWYVAIPFIVGCSYLLYLSWLFGPWLSVDTVSYFKVAEYYALFQFDKALNGAWSPLLSWLLVPGVWLSIDLTIWLRLLHVALVLGILVPLPFIALRKKKLIHSSHKLAFASVYIALGLTLSWWAMKDATPDFLSAVVAMYALYGAWLYDKQPSKRRAIALGALLSLLFFAKFAAIVVCVVILLGLNMRLLGRKRRSREGVQSLLWAVGIFTASLLLWSAGMYVKYGEFALSSTSSFNFALNGPNAKGYQQIDYPNKILPVPYVDSVTPWDDPAHIPPEGWDVKGNELYYAKHMGQTFAKFAWLFATMSPLVFIGVVGLRQKKYRRAGVFLLTMVAIVGVGYSFYHVWGRFLYLVLVPWIVYGVIVVGVTKQLGRAWAAGLIVVSFITAGGVAYKTVEIQSSALYMHSFMRIGHNAEGLLPEKSRVAVQSLELIAYCYYLDVQCPALNYKLADNPTVNRQLIASLKKEEVGYYVTRTPVKSDDVELLRHDVLPHSAKCLVRGQLYACGGASVLFYGLK